MKTKSFSLILIAFLFLSLSISIRCYTMVHFSNHSKPTKLIGLVPDKLRLVFAGVLWSKSDEYMHLGPSLREKTNYKAGSFAGNTELVSLLSLAIELAPHQPQAYAVLSQNLAKHLGLFTEGLRILQYGIRNNSDVVWVHELYAEAAFQYLFDVKTTLKTLSAARKYIAKAIERYPVDLNYKPRQKIYALQNYLMCKSRITEKLGKLNNKVIESNLSTDDNSRKPRPNKSSQSNDEHHKHSQNCSHNDTNSKIPLKMRLIYSLLFFLSIAVVMFKLQDIKKSV